MNIDPYEFLYMPRIIAGVFSISFSYCFANAVGIMLASIFLVELWDSLLHFFNNMRSYFISSDLWGGLAKSLFLVL